MCGVEEGGREGGRVQGYEGPQGGRKEGGKVKAGRGRSDLIQVSQALGSAKGWDGGAGQECIRR